VLQLQHLDGLAATDVFAVLHVGKQYMDISTIVLDEPKHHDVTSTKIPHFPAKNPTFPQKSPIFPQKNPIFPQKSPYIVSNVLSASEHNDEKIRKRAIFFHPNS